MEPAELIRAVRRRNGLTQVDLARRAGTAQSVISSYENGRRDPTFDTLRRLVEAGGEHVELDATPFASQIPPAADAEEHGRRLLDVLSLVDAIPTPGRQAELVAPRLVSA